MAVAVVLLMGLRWSCRGGWLLLLLLLLVNGGRLLWHGLAVVVCVSEGVCVLLLHVALSMGWAVGVVWLQLG